MQTDQPSLPTHRAFVVQGHATAELKNGQLMGRVEHIVSEQTTHFHSVEELVIFIMKVLIEATE
jgi:hypothetical protein